ncbi:MAG: CCA tRNA nucleotidyltransferase [Dongiaceae bacterium]
MADERPAGRVPPQPWMTAPGTLAVLAALAAGGSPARFVGGCVRDALLGRPVNDVDIATPEPPERVMALLRAAGLKALPTGIEHGTVTALAHGHHYEVTTLRRDVTTDGRRAVVAFTDDWAADAARRDFTINALFCDPDGTLHDHVGGIADLAERRIRFVGDPGQRIREDVLRLLRFFRFYAHLGRPPPDAAALAAARALAPLLPRLSGERVRAELLRLLQAADPAPVLRLMREAGVLAWLVPQPPDIDRLAALVMLEAAVPPPLVPAADALRRLAALVAGGAEVALGLAARLRLSTAERDRLAGMVEGPAVTPDLDRRAARRLLYRLGAAPFRDLALLAWAGAAARGEAGGDAGAGAEPWLALLALAAGWTRPALPVRGADAAALGIAPGPAIGRLLAAVESWWIEGDFTADRTACLARLSALAASSDIVGG